MAGIGNFRSALGGFNRQDVADYIAYINNKHSQEMEQLRNQLREAQERQPSAELEERLAEAEARCGELQAKLDAVRSSHSGTEAELESYRRAERAERLARNRAQKIYEQASAVLADAALKADDAAKVVDDITQQTAAQLDAYRQSVLDTRDAYRAAAAALYAIRPEEE